ncbi:MAG: M20/M25/M40 family metallo-hydrolase [Flavobacteriales bacterium]|jgi:hypothetical protein|nr:M20/M25/M40 family metallo-hydrolase [Flavobacteriales bacterium]
MALACAGLAAGAVLPAAQAVAQDDARTRGHRTVAALTAPAMHGRGYVQGGDSIAAEWIAAQFRAIGLAPLKDDFFQPFTFPVNSFPDSIGVALDDAVLRPGTDYLVHPASGTAVGRFPLVRVGLRDVLLPERHSMTMGLITGQAVLMRPPATADRDSIALYRALQRELMLHAPVVVPVKDKLTWGVAREALPFPLIEVRAEHLTDTTTHIDLHVRHAMRPRHAARNVLGMVKGRGKGWIVVGAHYDHLGRMGPDALFPGANDNASGVAMLLELARDIARKPLRHNVLFVAFAGEEAGLLGSEWFITDRPIDPGAIKLMLNLDILGTGDDGITVVNATAEPAHYDRLTAINARQGGLPQVKARGPACNSDHCPFVAKGIPALFIYTLGGAAHYHDVLDQGATLPLTKFSELHALLREFLGTTR